MLLLLDNYDSFTYNLVQYLGELGADVEVRRNDSLTVSDVARMQPEAVVLSPGPGRPENAGIMNKLILELADKVPILGVCLGHQAIAQVFGATIGYAPKLMHGKTSQVHHRGKTLFAGLSNPFVATRYHSLIVEPHTLSDEFETTAWTDDSVIMGIQHRQMALYGLQFHPESIMTPDGKDILKNFLESL